MDRDHDKQHSRRSGDLPQPAQPGTRAGRSPLIPSQPPADSPATSTAGPAAARAGHAAVDAAVANVAAWTTSKPSGLEVANQALGPVAARDTPVERGQHGAAGAASASGDGDGPSRDGAAPGDATAPPASRDPTDGDAHPPGADLKRPVQRRASGTAAPDTAAMRAAAAAGLSSPGSPLPFFDQIQSSFGRHDVSAVRSHVGGSAASANQQMGSLAYAMGDDVVFGGTPDLHTAAHEAAHTVQQRGGVSLRDGVGESGDAYEREADAVADLVVQGQSAEALLDRHPSCGPAAASAVQHKSAPPPPPAIDVLRQGPQFVKTAIGDSDFLSALESAKTVMNQGSIDMAQPSLDEVDAAWNRLMDAHNGGAARLAAAVGQALSAGAKMSPTMWGDFARLKDLVETANRAGDSLKQVEEKLPGADALLGAAEEFNQKFMAEVANRKDEDKKAEFEKKQADNAKGGKLIADFATIMVDGLKDLAGGKGWKGVGVAAAFSAAKVAERRISEALFHDEAIAQAITALEGQIAARAGKIQYADFQAVANLRAGFTSAKAAALMEHKQCNEKIASALRGVNEQMGHLEQYATGAGPDAAIGQVFLAADEVTAAVGPPAEDVRAAIGKAFRGPPTQGPGQGERMRDRDFPCDPAPADNPELASRANDPFTACKPNDTWDRLTSTLGKMRARVETEWNTQVPTRGAPVGSWSHPPAGDDTPRRFDGDRDRVVEERQAAIRAHEDALSGGTKTREYAHAKERLDAAQKAYDAGGGSMLEYEKLRAQYDTWMSQLASVQAWVDQARAWYDGQGPRGASAQFDWEEVNRGLDEKLAFVGGEHLRNVREAIIAVNNLMQNIDADKVQPMVW